MTPLQPPSDADAIEPLPDDLLLNILNCVSDVKSLGRCSAVSRRFRLLVPLVSSLLVPIDRIIFFSSPGNPIPPFSPALSLCTGAVGTTTTVLYFLVFSFLPSISPSSLLRLLKPLHSLGFSPDSTHHTLVQQLLENFSDLRTLHVVLPCGELSLNDSSPVLRWRAHFGSSLHRCLILAVIASPFFPRTASKSAAVAVAVADKDTIPDSSYTDLGEHWTMPSLLAASARHCLLQPVIAKQTTLESLVITDADGQGVLRMDRDQLEELRKKPISAALLKIPAIRMRQWYAPVIELSCGVVLEGAMLVAVRPSSVDGEKEEDVGLDSWIEEEFDGDGEVMCQEGEDSLPGNEPF